MKRIIRLALMLAFSLMLASYAFADVAVGPMYAVGAMFLVGIIAVIVIVIVILIKVVNIIRKNREQDK